jgi:hypothetical protein
MGAIHAAVGVAIMTISALPSAGESSSGRSFGLAPLGGPGFSGLSFAMQL